MDKLQFNTTVPAQANYVNDSASGAPVDSEVAENDASLTAETPNSTTPRRKKAQAGAIDGAGATAAAAQTRSVDGVGAVSSAGHSAPATGGVTQGGPSLPDVAGDKAPLQAVQMAIGNYVATPATTTSGTSPTSYVEPQDDAQLASEPSIKTAGSVSTDANDAGAADSSSRSAGGVISTGAMSVNYNADISMAAMYTILQSVIATAQKLSGNVKRNAQTAAVTAKQEGVADALDKLNADRKDAGFQLGASMLGAGLSLGMAFKGSDLQNRGDEASGAMLSALSRPINDLTTQVYNTISINSGLQLQSREADIAQKNADVASQIQQNNVESSKSAWDQTVEFIRNLNQTFLTLVQNKKSTTDQIAQR